MNLLLPTIISYQEPGIEDRVPPRVLRQGAGPVNRMHQDAERSSTPQYIIISRSESRYALIKKELLDPVGALPRVSCYFVRVDQDRGCICRIRAGYGAVMFYEVLDHEAEGITGEDIREAVRDPATACPLAGYFYPTPAIEEKLKGVRRKETSGYTARQQAPDRV